MKDEIQRAEVERRIEELREQLRQLELQSYAIRGALEAYLDLLKPTDNNQKRKGDKA